LLRANVKLSNVNVLPIPKLLVKTALVMPKPEILRKIFVGTPVSAPTKFAPPVDTDPNSVLPLKIDSVIEVFPVTKAPTEVTPSWCRGKGCRDGAIQKIVNNIGIANRRKNCELSDEPRVRTCAPVKLIPGN